MYTPDIWPLYNSKVYILILNFIFEVIGFILAIFHTMIYDLFVYITRWRFKSLFVTQWANFLVVSTFKCLIHNATTSSFYNNLSPRLYFILLYFITLNNLYCTATSKYCTEPCDCCTLCVGLTPWVLKMWPFPYPWIL
jgi:hypothetical protein